MGSHYIQVGKLKVDQALLDLACPAAGYDTTPPDPAIYCPAAGYYKEPTAWEAPITIPDPSTDQVLLLCDDLKQGVVAVYCRANTGNVKMELLAADTSIISSAEASTIHYMTFPTRNTGTHYLLRFTAVNAGAYLTTFYRNTFTGYATDYRILQAKFYAPNLTSLANAFNGISALKECVFYTNMNSLTNFSYGFASSGIEKITWPAEMHALTTMANCLQYTNFYRLLDLTNVSFSANVTFQNMCSESLVEKIIFSPTMANISSLQNFAYKAYNLTSVSLPTSANNSCTTLAYAFAYCSKLPAITVGEMQAVTSISYFVAYSPSITYVEFAGAMPSCTNISSLFRNCYDLWEAIMPTSLGTVTSSSYWMVGVDKLNKITMPLSLSGVIEMWGVGGNILEEMTTCNDWGSSNHKCFWPSHKLAAFYQPSLKVEQFAIGYSTTFLAPMTSVEIDWANSSYSYATAPQIVLRVELDATEINRIFTALPSVSGKGISVTGCPGAAGCNPAIAEAKGWTVTT